MAKKLKTKLDDIRKLSETDLRKELEEAHRRLFSMRLQRETRQLTNYQELPKRGQLPPPLVQEDSTPRTPADGSRRG